MSRIILASASPRRQEILSLITGDFEIATSDIDERQIEEEFLCDKNNNSDRVKQLSETLAIAKAKNVFDHLEIQTDTIVIGSDTSVIIGEEILGKPKDHNDAVRMLVKLSGKEHSVVTGVAIATSAGVKSFSNESLVTFNDFDERQEKLINEYCNTEEPYDKAGAYGIQGKGALLIKKINGDFYSIMGLPISQLYAELKQISDCKIIE